MRESDLAIRQLLIIRTRKDCTVVGRSSDVPAFWEEAACLAAERFGPRPPRVRCPGAVFAVPVGKQDVAVVQVADQGHELDDDPPLVFRFLFLTKKLYQVLGDPFAIADRFPPDWSSREYLPTLSWPHEPLPRRTVSELQVLLKNGQHFPAEGEPPETAIPGDGPLLLGCVQALVDGSRVEFRRDVPEERLVRAVWQLLPDRTRAELWPASFAFSEDLGFHLVVLPSGAEPTPGCISEQQVLDYPEGRYELALQTAIEAGDQADLERLFARRTGSETLRLALGMLVFALVASFVMKLI